MNMRDLLRHIRLNTGIKRKILTHPLTEMIVACWIKPHRLTLPVVPLSSLLRESGLQITLQQLHLTQSDSPYNDVVPLCFLAASLHPRRILEIGTGRGTTTAILALNHPNATIVTYDINPAAHENLRKSPLASRIDMRLIDIHQDLERLRAEPPFDFIFVDGEHLESSVRRDSELAFSLLAPKGMIVWHDYSNSGWLLGYNGVAEALADFAKTYKLATIEGTVLAVYKS